MAATHRGRMASADAAACLHSTFPIEIAYSPGKGRRIVASSSLPAGTLFLASSAASNCVTGDGCANCIFSRASNVCTGCHLVRYCGKSCQAIHWKTTHKGECAKLKHISTTLKTLGPAAIIDALLLVRLCKKLHIRSTGSPAWRFDLGTGYPVYSHAWSDVDGLESPAHSANPSVVLLAELIKATQHVEEDVPLLARLLAAFPRNNFMLCDELMSGKAACVFPAGALLNHSCAPNAFPSYEIIATADGRRTAVQVFRTLRAVDKGEELCHSYVEIASLRAVRQATLLNDYGFRCACQACELPLDDARHCDNMFEGTLHAAKLAVFGGVDGIPGRSIDEIVGELLLHAHPDNAPRAKLLLCHLSPFASAYTDEIYKLQSSFGWISQRPLIGTAVFKETLPRRDASLADEIVACEQSLLLVRQEVHPFHLDAHHVSLALYNRYLAVGDIFAGVAACEYLVCFYRAVFTLCPNHPMLGLQLFTLGDLYLQLHSKLILPDTLSFSSRSAALTTVSGSSELDETACLRQEELRLMFSYSDSSSREASSPTWSRLDLTHPSCKLNELYLLRAASQCHANSAGILLIAYGESHHLVSDARALARESLNRLEKLQSKPE